MTKTAEPNEPGSPRNDLALEVEEIADLELSVEQGDDVRGGRCTVVPNARIIQSQTL
ncbi:MAG TPA: hypothetical protein VLJ76_02575 [Gaiellaceae bacterium]|nr:hypothetical protein [Gaiellaceae bacterium]